MGGLGDVVTALGRAVQEAGNLVEVILPRFDLFKVPAYSPHSCRRLLALSRVVLRYCTEGKAQRKMLPGNASRAGLKQQP